MIAYSIFEAPALPSPLDDEPKAARKKKRRGSCTPPESAQPFSGISTNPQAENTTYSSVPTYSARKAGGTDSERAIRALERIRTEVNPVGQHAFQAMMSVLSSDKAAQLIHPVAVEVARISAECGAMPKYMTRRLASALLQLHATNAGAKSRGHFVRSEMRMISVANIQLNEKRLCKALALKLIRRLIDMHPGDICLPCCAT